MSKRSRSWFSFAADAAILAFAAQQVIALRMFRLGAGGAAAQSEAARMTIEKMHAAIDAGTILATGGSANKILRRYKTRVKANSRRLTRSR